ncbi:MAG: DUF1905 domain-containing protein [Terricaulis sp.]
MSARFQFRAKVWRHQSDTGAWHFATLPGDVSAQMRALSQGLRNAFGSLRVIATIGKTQWRTSVFADTKAGVFLLPVKADVRRAERIDHGDEVNISVEIDL